MIHFVRILRLVRDAKPCLKQSVDRIREPTLATGDCAQSMGPGRCHSRSAPIPPRSVRQTTCNAYTIAVTVAGLTNPKE